MRNIAICWLMALIGTLAFCSTPARAQFIYDTGQGHHHTWMIQAENFTQDGRPSTNLNGFITTRKFIAGISNNFTVDPNSTNNWRSDVYVMLDLLSTENNSEMYVSSSSHTPLLSLSKSSSLFHDAGNDTNYASVWLALSPGITRSLSHWSYPSGGNNQYLNVNLYAYGIFSVDPTAGAAVGQSYLDSQVPEPTCASLLLGAIAFASWRRDRLAA